MNKWLLVGVSLVVLGSASNAIAADVPIKAPVYKAAPIAPAWSWTGLYFGGHFGAAWSKKDWQTADGILAAAGFTPFQAASMIGGKFSGAQVGYNWQIGSWVFGPELSGSWADIYGNAKCGLAQFICNTKVDWFGTATARLGYATDHLLYYVKGGAAVVHDKQLMTTPSFANVFEGGTTRTGWTAGAGVEYAFTPSVSAFAEYEYLAFGTKSVAMTNQFANLSNIAIRQDTQLVKLGFNYRPDGEGKSFASTSAGMFTKAPMRLLSEWSAEVGKRYWYSSGKSRKDLYSESINSQLNSRLTYGPSTGHSLEAFARFDHRSGLFVKGFLGFGALVNGNLQDEDFPPVTVPYSSTNQDLKNGKMQYGALDIGHVLYSGPNGKIGPFVGYRSYYQQANGYGCAQTATNSGCAPAISTSFLGLSETENWRGIAVGLNGDIVLTDRLKLQVDAAYLPYVDRSGFDNHWLRVDINPLVDTGHGWGTQLEAIVTYAVTDRWSIGAGGRYWYFTTTSAQTQFPAVTNVSPMKFTANRYGGFIQTSYKFDASDVATSSAATGIFKVPARPVMATNWTGFYVGGHAGGGWGAKEWKSADGVLGGLSGSRFQGSGDVNGLLAGAQIGYNYQMGTWVVGVQADASVSDFYGNAKCATTFTGVGSGTCNSKVDSIGMVTGRLGRAYGKFLLYGDAGVAWAHDKYAVKSYTAGFDYNGSQTRMGWTLGTGIAYAMTPNWSVFGEYNYLSFGEKVVTLNDPVNGQSNVNIGQRLNVFKVGANYKFN